MDKKINLHFVSSTVGSIYEITNDLIDIFKIHFELTKEWEGEIPLDENRDILLLHFYDKEVVNNNHFNSFKKKVLIQPIDGTSIKPEVVDDFNKFDLIICPAQASKDIMIMNGVTTQIIIIPNYYKTDIFEKQIYTGISKYIPTNKIIFYHESTLHPRKGIELLYEAYVKAFSDTEHVDKVVLIVKDQPYNNQTFSKIENLKRQTIKLQRKYKKPAQIIKISSHLNFDELKDLWAATSIYVSLAKIEGFGIPMLRMFLMDKPIICLDNFNSGYMDYLNNDNAYLIPTIQHIAKDEFMYLYNENTSWAIPNINAVINIFKDCLNDFLSKNNKSMTKPYLTNRFSDKYIDNLKNIYSKYSFQSVSKKYVDTIKKIL